MARSLKILLVAALVTGCSAKAPKAPELDPRKVEAAYFRHEAQFKLMETTQNKLAERVKALEDRQPTKKAAK